MPITAWVARSRGKSPPSALRTRSSTMKSLMVMTISASSSPASTTAQNPRQASQGKRAEDDDVDEVAAGVQPQFGPDTGQAGRELAPVLVVVERVEGAQDAQQSQQPEDLVHVMPPP